MQVFCTKKQPNCNACPMRGECKHFASAFARYDKLRFLAVIHTKGWTIVMHHTVTQTQKNCEAKRQHYVVHKSSIIMLNASLYRPHLVYFIYKMKKKKLLSVPLSRLNACIA